MALWPTPTPNNPTGNPNNVLGGITLAKPPMPQAAPATPVQGIAPPPDPNAVQPQYDTSQAGVYAAPAPPLQPYIDAAGNAITQAGDTLRSQYAQLQAQQASQMAALQASSKTYNANQLSNFGNATNPIMHDLQAQGFSSSPLQQWITMDQQRLAAQGNNQTQLLNNLGANQQAAWANRIATGDQLMGGARAMLGQSALAKASARASGSGRGGGSGSSSGLDATSRWIANEASIRNGSGVPQFNAQGARVTAAGANAYQTLMNAATKVDPNTGRPLGAAGFLAAWNTIQSTANKQGQVGGKAGFNVNDFKKQVVKPYIAYTKKYATQLAAQQTANSNLSYLNVP